MFGTYLEINSGFLLFYTLIMFNSTMSDNLLKPLQMLLFFLLM